MKNSTAIKNKDVKFFYKDSCENDPFFKKYKEIIERQGSIQLTDNNKPVKAGNNTARIYNPYLFFILTTEKLPVLNCETKEDTTINGFDYLKTFIHGYIEGEEYFIREFEVSPDTRYKNPQYAKDIYFNYFDAKGGEGWEVIKRSHPLTFNHESIKKFGFDSGIVSKVEELKKKSPALFENFDNHKKVSGKPEAPEKINSEYTVKSVIIAYFYMYKKSIYPIPEIEKAGKKMKFYKKLAEIYKLSYDSFRNDWKPLEEKKNRLAQSENIKLAIKLLGTFDYPNIKEAIELANNELNEAELKS